MKNRNILIVGASVVLLGATMYWYFRKRKFTPTAESLNEEIEIVIKD